MLTCPPSRINLTASDLAAFDRRWAAKQSARKDAENVRLGQGAARQTRLTLVANTGRHRADSYSSQATICTVEDDEPTTHSNAASPAQRLDLPSLLTRTGTPQSTTSRRDRTLPHSQKTGQSRSTRSPTRPAPEQDFSIYEDPPLFQAFVEARHFQHPGTHRTRELGHVRPATSDLQPTTANRTQPVSNAPQIPTINQPLLYPLDPGAPVFVPRTRFGSTTSNSPDNDYGGVRLDGLVSPVQRDLNTANLRVQSSFERNSQHSSRGTERQSIISDSSLSLVPADLLQHRRRSRYNNQNAALQRPVLGLDRYPAIRPPIAYASRRNSGSQRQVIFPHRRSSRQHLIEFERSRRTQETRQHHRSSHLTVPENHGHRPVSPAASTSSRSTPNLLQHPSVLPVHTRSSSLSLRETGNHLVEELPPQRSRKAATTLSESSSLIEEILLHRDSPLDRIVQKYCQHPARPRSVGHSFERPPGRQTRPSLLNGNLFGEEASDDLGDNEGQAEHVAGLAQPLLKQVKKLSLNETSDTTPRKSLKDAAQTPHKRDSMIEDPVALALALPSPEVPPSSPVVRSSPQLPSTPIPRPSPSSPPSREAGSAASSAARSHISTASLTPSSQSLAAAVTPRVPVYNDSQPRNQQPQTPADIGRSSHRNRGRSNTTSTVHSALSVVQPSPTLAPPERHLHRHTFPSATPEVTVGAVSSAQAAAVIGPPMAVRRESLNVGFDQRSSNSSSENDIEGTTAGLEQDRRVWINRREDSSLDVTPPREGRFERYLS